MSTLLELAEFSAAAYGDGPAPTTGAAGEGGTRKLVGTLQPNNPVRPSCADSPEAGRRLAYALAQASVEK